MFICLERSHICGVTSNYESYMSSADHDEATQATIISSDSVSVELKCECEFNLIVSFVIE